MRAGLAVLTALILVSPAHACRLHSIWKYPFPQRCPIVAQLEARTPPIKPSELAPKPDIDIPLPSLEHMEFPPDDLDERLKGIGMLRQLRGTN